MGHHHVFSKFWDNVVYYIILALGAYIAYAILTVLINDFDTFLEVMEAFALTPQDVKMIPFGAFFFFVFWKAFETLVFKRFLDLHESREAATEGAQSTAEALVSETASIENSVEQQVFQARTKFTKEKLELLEERKKANSSKLAEKLSEIETQTATARADLVKELGAMESDLNTRLEDLTGLLVGKLKEHPQTVKTI